MSALYQQIGQRAKEPEGETARFPSEYCPVDRLSAASAFDAGPVARLNGKA